MTNSFIRIECLTTTSNSDCKVLIQTEIDTINEIGGTLIGINQVLNPESTKYYIIISYTIPQSED